MRVHSAKVSSCRPATWPPGLASAITLRHRKGRNFSVPTTCGWGETLILRSVSGRCVPTRRLNVRSACSGRSNDRPLGGIRRLGCVT